MKGLRCAVLFATSRSAAMFISRIPVNLRCHTRDIQLDLLSTAMVNNFSGLSSLKLGSSYGPVRLIFSQLCPL
jgi:hypothetical protein